MYHRLNNFGKIYAYMEASLYLKVLDLKESLENDERIIRLNEIEKEMAESEELMKLSYKKDMACVAFSDALKHFSNNSEEVKKLQKSLYEAKYQLDIHPLTKKYNAAYKEAKALYSLINKALFSPFMKEEGEIRD